MILKSHTVSINLKKDILGLFLINHTQAYTCSSGTAPNKLSSAISKLSLSAPVKAALEVLTDNWTMYTYRKKSVVFLFTLFLLFFLTFSECLNMYVQVSLKFKISLPQLSGYREYRTVSILISNNDLLHYTTRF